MSAWEKSGNWKCFILILEMMSLQWVIVKSPDLCPLIASVSTTIYCLPTYSWLSWRCNAFVSLFATLSYDGVMWKGDCTQPHRLNHWWCHWLNQRAIHSCSPKIGICTCQGVGHYKLGCGCPVTLTWVGGVDRGAEGKHGQRSDHLYLLIDKWFV